METLIQQIANLGFPIVLSMYLLVRIESKMELLTNSIHQLSTAIGQDKGGAL